MLAITTAVAMAAALSFSVLFGAPKKHWLFCSMVGGIAWLVYSLLIGVGISPVVSCFFATLALTFFARLLSFARRAPVILFLVAGIFPLVPGAKLYFTATYLFASQYTLGVSEGIETLKFAGAITLGILSGFALPARLFTILLPRDKQK